MVFYKVSDFGFLNLILYLYYYLTLMKILISFCFRVESLLQQQQSTAAGEQSGSYRNPLHIASCFPSRAACVCRSWLFHSIPISILITFITHQNPDLEALYQASNCHLSQQALFKSSFLSPPISLFADLPKGVQIQCT